MNPITQSERDAMRHFLDSMEYKALFHIAEVLIEKIKDERGFLSSEWEAAKTTIRIDAQIEGIRRLQQEIFNQAKQ